MKEYPYQLIGSAPSLEKITECIGKYWCSSEPYILKPDSDGITWGVYYPASSKKAGQQLTRFRVRLAGGRYRFEARND